MYIYKITNSKNGKIYIGQSSKQSLVQKFKSHKWLMNNKRNYDYPLYVDMRKYGIEAFSICKLVSDIQTIEQLNIEERAAILSFESYKEDIGYNVSMGGIGYNVVGERHHRYGTKNERFAELNRQRAGKSPSQETRVKLSIASTGRTHSDASKEKQSQIKKEQWKSGVYSSDEYKKKMSESKKGISHPNVTARKKVLCNETKEVFESITAAAIRFRGDVVGISNIHRQLNGKNKSAFGHTFSYV